LKQSTGQQWAIRVKRDRTIMEWSLTNGYIVFTNDLDFGAILAATQR
jgi:predicted nuclease of predicted toxin-antitoxin system